MRREREREREMEEARGERKLKEDAIDRITQRLSPLEDLYFPRALLPNASTPSQRKSLLTDLLSRDAPVFLERYGPQLTAEELQEFDVLKDDYEIGWHLKHLRSLLSPTSEQLRSRSVTVKNRRRAYMDKLVSEGRYFSEDAMREREPYLHHEYLGKFQDPYGRRMARPGERWSETLMRRAEEAILLAKIRGEQQRLGVDESEWVGNERGREEEEMEEEEDEEEEEMEEEEEESEEEEEEEKEDRKEDQKDHATSDGVSGPSQDQNGAPNGEASTSSVHHQPERPTLSPAEMQEQLDQFTYIMQQKFLSGQDREHINYSKIDEDETLDDHWLKEANYDIEEKYFEED